MSSIRRSLTLRAGRQNETVQHMLEDSMHYANDREFLTDVQYLDFLLAHAEAARPSVERGSDIEAAWDTIIAILTDVRASALLMATSSPDRAPTPVCGNEPGLEDLQPVPTRSQSPPAPGIARQMLQNAAFDQTPSTRDVLVRALIQADDRGIDPADNIKYLDHIQEGTQAWYTALITSPGVPEPTLLVSLRRILAVVTETRTSLYPDMTSAISAPSAPQEPETPEVDEKDEENGVERDTDSVATGRTGNTIDTVITGDIRIAQDLLIEQLRYNPQQAAQQMVADLGNVRRDELIANDDEPTPTAPHANVTPPRNNTPGVNAWAAFARNATEVEDMNSDEEGTIVVEYATGLGENNTGENNTGENNTDENNIDEGKTVDDHMGEVSIREQEEH